MTLIAIAVILFSTILLILCLPVTYEVTLHIGKPYHFAFCVGWGRKLIQKSWSYTVGEEAKGELSVFWKKDDADGKNTVAESREEALQILEEESQQTTYEDLPSIEEAEKEADQESPQIRRKKRRRKKKRTRRRLQKKRRAAPASGFPSSSTPIS